MAPIIGGAYTRANIIRPYENSDYAIVISCIFEE
jgi:hypothetical protein